MLQEYYDTSRETGIRYGEAESLGFMGIALMRNNQLKEALNMRPNSAAVKQALRRAENQSGSQPGSSSADDDLTPGL